MTYKCIKEFYIDKYDADGFCTGESEVVEENTVWERDDDISIIGGEVHLEDLDGLKWIEITFGDLKDKFELVS